MGGNIIIIHGRLTADPESRTYKKADGNESSMTTYCVACDARFGDKSYFYDCTMFGRNAELALAHLKKGREVVVYGELTYNDKNDKRYYTVNVDRFDFCGSKNDGNKAGDSLEEVDKDVPF